MGMAGRTQPCRPFGNTAEDFHGDPPFPHPAQSAQSSSLSSSFLRQAPPPAIAVPPPSASCHPESAGLRHPLTDAADSPPRDAGLDESQEEFLGALAALGGSAGNGRLRDVLTWDEATYDAVKAQLLSRGLVVPGRGRGGSVALLDGEGPSAPPVGADDRPARRPRAARGANGSTASGFETTFRAIDDCLRKEEGCGTELDYT